MADVLQEICAKKREHVAAQKRKVSEAALLTAAKEQTPPRGFMSALQNHVAARRIGLIAEVKKASPSKGVIREDFDPVTLALAYQNGGASCVSVLTDQHYFSGEDVHFAAARKAIILPMIRKDFIVDSYQVAETRALGADCLLLIVAALSPPQAKEIEAAALDFGMDVLIEVHDEAELDTALTHLKSRFIGINNRNLKTLGVDLATTARLAPSIPQGYLAVCESGVRDAKDIATVRQSGVDCFLIGESLMRQADVETATRRLVESNAQ